MKNGTLYFPVYLTLVVLTALTLGSFYAGFGRVMAITLALGIAFTKAVLIALYYMHLKNEKPVIFGIVFVGLAAVVILTLGILPDVALIK